MVFVATVCPCPSQVCSPSAVTWPTPAILPEPDTHFPPYLENCEAPKDGGRIRTGWPSTPFILAGGAGKSSRWAHRILLEFSHGFGGRAMNDDIVWQGGSSPLVGPETQPPGL